MDSRLTKRSNVNADLLAERNRCTFASEDFAEWWHNGPAGLRDKRERDLFVLTNPELHDEMPTAHLSHKQRYEEAVRKGTIVMDKIRQLINRHQPADVRANYLNILYGEMCQFTGMLGAGSMTDGNPLGVHFGMFLPTIMGQGTDAQIDEWLMRAWRLEFVGTYVQTELGHGTFLRGLQTTATFDAATDEFVLHTPSISAYKWWPGGLGHTCNYAVVMAQLYIDGQHHGLHPFIVQLRDSDTWQPLAGIHVGEVGPKFGFHGVNNGFLGLRHVRIPRSAMLARNAQVTRDGRFQRSTAPAVLTYGTMIFVRVSLARDMTTYLSRAATIAVRYAAVRHQSPIDPARAEPQIIEHVTQQRKLLPNVATALVFKLAADRVWRDYEAVVAEMGAGDLRRLPEIHALSCCLKSVSTQDAAAGVEQLRLACGGHGYMEGSALPGIYTAVMAACTYDGENTVMLLQTARFLVKSWKRALGAGSTVELPETVRYLRAAVLGRSVQWTAASSSLEGLVGALQTVAANKIRLAFEHIERRIGQGHGPEVAANLTSIEMASAAEAHCRAYLVQSAVELTADVERQVTEPLSLVIRQLVELYALVTCEQLQADLIRFTAMSDADINRLHARLETLLAELRPNAVAIVDGFDHPDAVLCSTLGAYDGRVYERLFAEAQTSELNRAGISASFEKYMKPLMRARL